MQLPTLVNDLPWDAVLMGSVVSTICRDSTTRTCDPLVPNQMRYQAALRPERCIYIDISIFFNLKMRMNSELNGNIRLIDWGRIGGFKKKLLVGNQRLFNLKNYFGGFLGVLKWL